MNAAQESTSKRSLTELTTLIVSGDYTVEDFKEFQSLVEGNKSAKEKRKEKISEIHKLIGDIGSGEAGIKPDEVVSLFPKELLLEVVNVIRMGKVVATVKISNSKGMERTSDKEMELFFVPKGSGKGEKSFSLRKGRIFERYNRSNATPFVMNEANFPKKLLMIGASESDLMKHISHTNTRQAKEYLATAEGKVEIAKILEVVAMAKKKLTKT